MEEGEAGMSDGLVVSDPQPGVRTLAIARPARKNALDSATYCALSAALRSAERDESVRAVVLTGSGDTFTAGNDLADFQKLDDTGGASDALKFLHVISGFPKPVIAAVEGVAVGIGVTVLLHCDLAYAGRSSRFRMPFVALGLCPEGASTFLLPRLAGSKRAAELLYFGEAFSAEEAEAAGILNGVTDDGAALEMALDRAGALAALPVEPLIETKRLLRAGTAQVVTETLDREGEAFQRLRRGPAAQAAFAAFFRK